MPIQVPRAGAFHMSYKHYAGDPRQMSARFASTCHTCKKQIKKGEEIIYWPATKSAGHLACDQTDFSHSVESFMDEEMYRSEFSSDRGDPRDF